MKTRYIYFFVVLVILVIAIIAESTAPVPVDWSSSYSMYDKIPYGDYVVYDVLPDLFPDKKITVSDEPLYVAFDDSVKNTNLILINNYFDPDSLDAIKLLSYVHRGNNAFIASQSFYGTFADSLKISTSYTEGFRNIGRNNNGISTYKYTPYPSGNDSITLSLLDSTDQVFAYRDGTVQNYFVDSSNAEPCSKNSNNKDVFIAIKFGKGAFYLSSVPKAFTNYNILNGNNYEYISRCLSYLPVEDTYWDEHYKEVSHKASTPLRFVLGTPSLRFAYYIMLAGILIYLIFEGKRLQRVVPVIKPLQNTSLEFTETIGRLYYEMGNNIGIAKKRINFFSDAIRNKFKMTTDETNPYFYSNLSEKTLISKEELTELFKYIRYVEAQSYLTSESLLRLNKLLENFYTKTQ